MIKKRNIVLAVVFVLVSVIGIRLFIAHQEISKLKDDTILYLTEKDYDPERDIEEMNIVDIDQDEEIKAVVVTFKDEPRVDYFYAYKKATDQITQIDVVNKGSNQILKHKES